MQNIGVVDFTCRRIVLQEPKELDLQPRSGHLVVNIFGRIFVVYYELGEEM